MSGLQRLIISAFPRAQFAALQGMSWALIGLLYAFLFVSVLAFVAPLVGRFDPLAIACVFAGTLSALIYSSMRLAVILAAVLFPGAIILFGQSGGQGTLAGQLEILLPAGVVIGALYGLLSRHSNIGRADAKALAGFSVGFITSLIYLLVTAVVEPVSLALVVGLMSPLTGLLYLAIVSTFIRLYQHLLPAVVCGALVGASVAVFVSFSFLVMVGSIDTSSIGAIAPHVERINVLLPHAALGGVLGAGCIGLIAGLFMNERDLSA